MSTITLPFRSRAPARAAAKPPRGLFARIWQSIIEAQQERADSYVARYLSQLPPAELEAYGFSLAEIERLRRLRVVARH